MSVLVYVRLDNNEYTVWSDVGCTTPAPIISIKQGGLLDLDVKFSSGGSHVNLSPAGAVGKFCLKRSDRATAANSVTQPHALRVINFAWGDDSGSPLTYTFETTIAGALLNADLLQAAHVDYDADIVLQFPGSPSLQMSIGLVVRVVSAVYVPQEATPDAFFHRGRAVYVDPNYTTMLAAGINAVGTMQAAWDYVTALQTSEPGRAIIYVGNYPTGGPGDATITGALINEVSIIGTNVANSPFGGLFFDYGATVDIEVMHCQGNLESLAGNINLTGLDAIIGVNVNGYLDPGPGDAIAAGVVTVSGPGIVLINTTLDGSTPNASPDGVAGKTGGAAGTLTLSHGARATAPSLKPGNGGQGGGGFGDGGDGGPAGAPGVLNVGPGCEVSDPDMTGAVGGDGGSASGADGDGGLGGDGGTINQSVGSIVTGAILSNGSGGLGGTGAADGADGSVGTINGAALDIPALVSVPPAAPVSGGRLYFDGTAFKVRLPNGDIKTVTVS